MSAFSTATTLGNKDFEVLGHPAGAADLNEPDVKACQRLRVSANNSAVAS